MFSDLIITSFYRFAARRMTTEEFLVVGGCQRTVDDVTGSGFWWRHVRQRRRRRLWTRRELSGCATGRKPARQGANDDVTNRTLINV